MLNRQRGDALVYPFIYRSDSITKMVVVSILLAGDIHPNPGPVRHPCGICGTPVAESHRAVCCDYCDQWVHIRCAGISQSVYNRLSETSNEWYCSLCSGIEYPYQPESVSDREARLATRRRRRLEESEDDREARLATRRQRRMNESEQEREATLGTRRQRRLEESEDDREARLATRRQRRMNESEQETEATLGTRRQRRLEESEDDREARLATRRQRRMNESEQEREATLGTRRQRRLEESEDDREARLATRRQRRMNESEQEREATLGTRRQRRLEESEDDREARLATRRQRRMNESEQETEATLATRRQRRLNESAQQRTNPNSHGHNHTSQNSYLYEGGWRNIPLHEQPWVNDIMMKFQKKQDKWNHIKCTLCNEMWPIRFQPSQIETYTCIHCKRDKNIPKLFSPQNDMDPGVVPQCLENMTQIEEMLIARACPIMTVYRKHGGQRGYSGHVLNLPQNI